MSRRRDAVLFDLDGVLVDSRAAVAGCINHALVAHGLPARAERDLHRFIGPPLAIGFAELTGHPVGSPEVAACVAAYRERYADASLRDTVVATGLAPVLGALGHLHRLGVATSKPLAFADPLLRALALRDHFDVVAGPDLTARNEDKAATIGAALDALDPDRVVMVGDRSFDVLGAHAHGMPVVGVTWGIGDRDELAAAGADAIIDSPAALPVAVRGLLEGLQDQSRNTTARQNAASPPWNRHGKQPK